MKIIAIAFMVSIKYN